MEKINNFQGLLVYTTSNTDYDDTIITNITNKSPYILDYVILDIKSDKPKASEVLRVAKSIYAHRANARFWIGTCRYDSIHTSNKYNEMVTSLNEIKTAFINDATGKRIWDNCVKGIYLNMESIYHPINYNVGPDQNNGESFVIAKNLSNYVHNSMGLNFLWIPYYGYGPNAAEVIKKIAYVVARTNIFDIVILQPHYYFDASVSANLKGVKYCIDKNNIFYRDGVEVFKRTCNSATVGYEMEVEDLAYADSDRRKRYDKYVETFKGCTNVPICYYAGGLQNLRYNYPLMGLFFGIIYGDADGNGILTANDSSVVSQYTLVGPVPDGILMVGDVDGNGFLSSNDSALILQKTLQSSFEFPIIKKIYNASARNEN